MAKALAGQARLCGSGVASLADPSPEVMTTILNVFKNAFIKAFEGKLSDDNIELPKVDPEK